MSASCARRPCRRRRNGSAGCSRRTFPRTSSRGRRRRTCVCRVRPLLWDIALDDWSDLFPRIELPALVVGAENSLYSVASQRWIAAQFPNGRALPPSRCRPIRPARRARALSPAGVMVGIGTAIAIALLAVGFNGLGLIGILFRAEPLFDGIVLLIANAEARQVKVGS